MYPSTYTRLGRGVRFCLRCLPRSFYICFVSSSYPNYSGIHYNVHRYGHIPGALARTVGRIGGVHGIDTRCAVITTPAVFLLFSGLCDG